MNFWAKGRDQRYNSNPFPSLASLQSIFSAPLIFLLLDGANQRSRCQGKGKEMLCMEWYTRSYIWNGSSSSPTSVLFFVFLLGDEGKDPYKWDLFTVGSPQSWIGYWLNEKVPVNQQTYPSFLCYQSSSCLYECWEREEEDCNSRESTDLRLTLVSWEAIRDLSCQPLIRDSWHNLQIWQVNACQRSGICNMLLHHFYHAFLKWFPTQL